MKTLIFNSPSTEKNINTANLSLGGSVIDMGGVRALHFDNQLGEGSITSINLEGGLSYMQYEVRLNERLKIIIEPAPLTPIYFMYCLKGNIVQSSSETSDSRSLHEFQTAILGGGDTTKEIIFPAEKKVKLCVIRVVNESEDPNEKAPGALKQSMYELFSEGKKAPIRYFGSFNLRIGEQLAQIDKINQEGIVKKLFIEGILNLTLAMEIQHLKTDMENEKNPKGSLTQHELQNIKEVSRKIEKHPEIQYSIKSICSECGLSASKLQEGFKLLHGKTVSDFIRNERLSTAERLISTTDMNISEIVYTVGLSSRSYFSKIFKRRYKCSPKMYQDNKKSLVA